MNIRDIALDESSCLKYEEYRTENTTQRCCNSRKHSTYKNHNSLFKQHQTEALAAEKTVPDNKTLSIS